MRIDTIFLVILLSISALAVKSQDKCDLVIEGKVLDGSTGSPLPFATVLIKGLEKGTVTDEFGQFKIGGLCHGEYDLEISYVGYKTLKHHHDPYHKVPVFRLAPDNVLLEGVVVEGEYHGEHLNSISSRKMDEAEIRNSNALDLGTLANQLSGVSILSTGGNIAKPMIHGLHSSRIIVINNEIRHEFQNWGPEHAPEIDVQAVDHIEVIKGAATVAYGPEAMGGVIMIDQKLPHLHEKLSLKSNITARSNGRGVQNHFDISKGFDKTAFRLNIGGVFMGDLQAPDYLLTNTGKRELGVGLAVIHHRKEFQIESQYSHLSQELGILRGAVTENLVDLANAIGSDIPFYTAEFSYDIANPRQTVSHDLFKIKTSWRRGEHLLVTKSAVQSNARKEFDVRRGNLNSLPSIDLVMNSYSTDVEWFHPKGKRNEGNVGFQWMAQTNSNIPGTNTVSFIPNYFMNRAGAYFVEKYEFSSWIAELGLRYDHVYYNIAGRNQDNSEFFRNVTFANFSGTLGISKMISNELTFSSNIGTAWRPPNIAELFIFGKHQSSIEYGLLRYEIEDGNVIVPSLAGDRKVNQLAEKGYKWLSSLDYNKESLQWSATGYINLINDYIFSRPAGITNTVRGAFPYFVYDRTDAQFFGIDMDLQKQVSRFSIMFSSSLLYARQKNGDPLIEIPPARLSTGIEKDFGLPNANVVFHLDMQYVFRAWYTPRVITLSEIQNKYMEGLPLTATGREVFDILPPPSGFLLLNSFVRYSRSKYDLQLRCDNILNQEYRNYTDRLRYFAQAPGRNVILSINFHI